MTLALVDLEVSNVGSMAHALQRIGAPAHVLATPSSVASAAAILLPGVGAFGDAMKSLRGKGLVEPIQRAVTAGTPLLGICLGMQLLADESAEHGVHRGLGLVPGRVTRLPADTGLRVPNVGWCDVAPTRPSVLFPNGGGTFYHVHSFHVAPADPSCVTAAIDFGDTRVVVALESGNLFGVQFHPEKSQDDGLEVLARFFDHLSRTGRVG